MLPIKKLLIQSNSQSLLQWKELLQEQVTPVDKLSYRKGEFTQNTKHAVIEKASLVMMGRTFTCAQLQLLLALIENEGVENIALHAPKSIQGVIAIRLVLSDYPSTLKEKLDQFATNNTLDFALSDTFPDWNKTGVILMDMDSTTIQIECIDEIARLYGVGEEVSAVTASAMRGELDFNESLRTRVGKLNNAPVSILKKVADTMPLMPGLIELIKSVKQAGWKIAIASGGFNYFADRLKQDHGFDYTIANTLEMNGQFLTGNVLGTIVNAQVKAETLAQLAERYDVPMSQTVAIGDGANDLLMLAASGLGIAIHAKPIVQAQAAVAINYTDLFGALVILSACNSNSSWT